MSITHSFSLPLSNWYSLWEQTAFATLIRPVKLYILDNRINSKFSCGTFRNWIIIIWWRKARARGSEREVTSCRTKARTASPSIHKYPINSSAHIPTFPFQTIAHTRKHRHHNTEMTDIYSCISICDSARFYLINTHCFHFLSFSFSLCLCCRNTTKNTIVRLSKSINEDTSKTHKSDKSVKHFHVDSFFVFFLLNCRCDFLLVYPFLINSHDGL